MPGPTGENDFNGLDSAKSVEEASSHHPADNSVAYWYASRLLSCRALLQAQQLNLDLVALAVWNGKPGFGRGGTASFIEFGIAISISHWVKRSPNWNHPS